MRCRIDAFPLGLYACHCTDCQRQSVSAFAMTMPVAISAFDHIRCAKSVATNNGDAQVTAWICADCGVRLYGERDVRPDNLNIRSA